MDEKVFYDLDGIKVTNSRFIVAGQTYAISNITSVKSTKNQKSNFSPFLIGLIALVALLNSSSMPYYIVSGSILVLVIYWGIHNHKNPDYSVSLDTASGKTAAYASRDKDQILNIVEALNEAIISR